jgi:uncharacterized protein YdeI (BOF family)
MKRIVLSVAGVLLILTAAPQMGRAMLSPALNQQQPKPQSKMFSGTILKNGEKYILSDSANKISYTLDDTQKASQYEGKKVKVTGTVDMATNTIHVETIQEIA